MSEWWPAAWLSLMVAALLLLDRQPVLGPLFQWLPVPLWCYLLPAVGLHLGWLPREAAQMPIYRPLIQGLLPIALVLLLLGADLRSILRTGTRALIAAATGAVGVLLGVSLGVWLMRAHLPAQAWKGAGALAGTWTGGTMNLLALRTLLDTPEAMFAPLILVDAMIAYGWMALLMAASGSQQALNRWLRAKEIEVISTSSEAGDAGRGAPRRTRWGMGGEPVGALASPAAEAVGWPAAGPASSRRLGRILCCLAVALIISWSARWMAARLPTTPWVSSASGWTVWLVTTMTLALSLVPFLRRLGSQGSLLGYPCLYLVLAATGAQASLQALAATPAWVVVGLVVIAVHVGLLLVVGRWGRLPLGVLATASQANIGGVVSAPMVGAVYHPSLAPLGAVLAIAGHALGTYLGIVAAHLCRWLTRSA
jgi:uncharacterized membrane protein